MEWHVPGLIAPSNRTPPPRFVTDVVLELGLAGHDDVHAAVDAARATGARPEAVLLRNGVLDEDRLAHALAERYGLDRLDFDHFPVDGGAAALVTVDTALRHEALPVAHLDGGRLLVAVADPAGGPAANAIARATGREVVPALAPRQRLRGLIEATASRVAVPLPQLSAADRRRPSSRLRRRPRRATASPSSSTSSPRRAAGWTRPRSAWPRRPTASSSSKATWSARPRRSPPCAPRSGSAASSPAPRRPPRGGGRRGAARRTARRCRAPWRPRRTRRRLAPARPCRCCRRRCR
jgi:hypothetical protein